MPHDFKKYPELTNKQMQFYYFESPHKQITENFRARVVKVHDGDTIRITCNFRDFDFSMKLTNLQAPELWEAGGIESRDWLAEKILGEEVDVVINPAERVEKWGRLLGNIIFQGVDVGEESVNTGHGKWWWDKEEGKFPDLNKELDTRIWLS